MMLMADALKLAFFPLQIMADMRSFANLTQSGSAR